MLVDTNVWLDFYLANRPLHDKARLLVDKALEARVELLASVTTVKDLYYLVAEAAKRMIREDAGREDLTQAEALSAKAYAQGCLDNVLELAFVVGTDEGDVRIARRLEAVHADFEDDLVAAAAMRSDADYVVTNDERFLRRGPVATATTQDALSLLDL